MAVPADVTAFYLPPPNGTPNPFAEFWSNFLQTRTPWVMQAYQARLAALDPSAQYAAIAALGDQRAKLLEQQAKNERVASDQAIKLQLSSDETARTLAELDTKELVGRMDASSPIQAAQTGLEGDLITASSVAPVQFAREIFARLGVYEPDVLASWYRLFGEGDPAGYFELVASQAS
jgi:hypothetical protein